MNRKDMLNKLQEPEKVWDMVVVGGGATGLGVAVDAATRGYSVVLLEMADFAKSTSSRQQDRFRSALRRRTAVLKYCISSRRFPFEKLDLRGVW